MIGHGNQITFVSNCSPEFARTYSVNYKQPLKLTQERIQSSPDNFPTFQFRIQDTDRTDSPSTCQNYWSRQHQCDPDCCRQT